MQTADYPAQDDPKERRRAYMRAYRERNREKLAAQNYAWRKRNPGKVAASHRRSIKRSREKRDAERYAAYPEVPADFGHWLAGFIDGEGSFVITRNNLPGSGYRVHFALGVRDDDSPILQECVAITGVGRLYHRPNRARAGHVCRPTTVWMVNAKPDCRRLVEILDRFPLRAKKARDYAIWRDAVVAHARIQLGVPSRFEPPPSGWEPLARLREQLIAARAYDATRAMPDS